MGRSPPGSPIRGASPVEVGSPIRSLSRQPSASRQLGRGSSSHGLNRQGSSVRALSRQGSTRKPLVLKSAADIITEAAAVPQAHKPETASEVFDLIIVRCIRFFRLVLPSSPSFHGKVLGGGP